MISRLAVSKVMHGSYHQHWCSASLWAPRTPASVAVAVQVAETRAPWPWLGCFCTSGVRFWGVPVRSPVTAVLLNRRGRASLQTTPGKETCLRVTRWLLSQKLCARPFKRNLALNLGPATLAQEAKPHTEGSGLGSRKQPWNQVSRY